MQPDSETISKFLDKLPDDILYEISKVTTGIHWLVLYNTIRSKEKKKYILNQVNYKISGKHYFANGEIIYNYANLSYNDIKPHNEKAWKPQMDLSLYMITNIPSLLDVRSILWESNKDNHGPLETLLEYPMFTDHPYRSMLFMIPIFNVNTLRILARVYDVKNARMCDKTILFEYCNKNGVTNEVVDYLLRIGVPIKKHRELECSPLHGYLINSRNVSNDIVQRLNTSNLDFDLDYGEMCGVKFVAEEKCVKCRGKQLVNFVDKLMCIDCLKKNGGLSWADITTRMKSGKYAGKTYLFVLLSSLQYCEFLKSQKYCQGLTVLYDAAVNYYKKNTTDLSRLQEAINKKVFDKTAIKRFPWSAKPRA